MMLRFCTITAAFLVLTALVSACGNSPPTPTGAPVATSTTANGRVPDNLATIEEQAEDIMDSVPNAQWSHVEADIVRIEEAWTAYQPQASSEGATQALQDMLSQALVRLKSTAILQDSLGTLQAANDLSAAVIDLFDLYQPVIPTDIGRLDVLERQIILDITNGDFNTATSRLARINTVWEQVKPSILAHHGQSVSEEFANSLARQDVALKAKDSAALTDEAQNSLEIVDTLERLY